MGIFAAILGGIGGLCAIFGVITILELVTIDLSVDLTWDFWLIISAVLFLASIAISVGYKGEMGD
jgi:hypothetical protein